ncbi:DUF6387 family protein [Rosenbergiella epipactidis]|uniref:DUF6387 family protein n=1 Tax=Rosenbergiella epipactidis TaxID=1544694 RepID=UPI001F4D69FA|nr:DUF6387 family protein [Rosenbergiella epipactidis]
MKVNEINIELQSWFNIENYQDVEKLSLRAFYKEFQVRRNICEGMDFFEGDHPTFKMILGGKSLISQTMNMEELSNHNNSHIHQVSFKQLESLKRTLELFSHDSFVKGTNELKKEIRSQPITSIMKDIIKENSDNRLFISFDIKYSSDEEIINALKVMLPIWRDDYQITESKVEKFGLAKIIKLIDYRILPMMDLLLWAKFKKIALTNTVLSRILYPRLTDEIRGEEQLKETDRPLAEKALSGETCKSIENFINKNNHMESIALSGLRSLL